VAVGLKIQPALGGGGHFRQDRVREAEQAATGRGEAVARRSAVGAVAPGIDCLARTLLTAVGLRGAQRRWRVGPLSRSVAGLSDPWQWL